MALLCGVVVAVIWAKRAMDRPPEVTVEQVAPQDVERVLAVTGRLRPRSTVEIRPRRGGRIDEVGFEQGQSVSRGDRLLTIDSRTARRDLDRAAAAVAQARDQLAQARREARRVERLAAAGIVSQSDLESSLLAVDVRARDVEQLEEGRRSLEVTLADYTLVAPLEGWVVERLLDPGQNVEAGAVVLVLASAEAAQVEVDIDEQYLPELRVGMTATAAPLAGDARYVLRIESLGRQVEAETGAVPVRFDFVQTAPDLPAGLTFDVNLDIERHPAALTVRREALYSLGSDPYVAIVEDGKVEHRQVEVLDWPAPRVVVRRGLQVGDRVILAPKGLAPGTEVRTVSDASEAARDSGASAAKTPGG